MINVKIEHLTKRYNKNFIALSDVNLNFKAGTMTAILGPSGCGKTTLLRSLGGFLKVDEGSIRFGDRDVTCLQPQQRGAALVFQNYALWPHMTVYDNIAYGLRIKKVSEDKIRKKIEEIVDIVELDTAVLNDGRKPTQLSGGQQQRVALARALVVEPQVFLLDEPLSNLDAKVRAKLRVHVRNIQKRVGITAVYVTHDQEEALSMADTVVIMNRGKVMQVGTPEDVYEKPQNEFVAEFLGDSHIIKGIAKSKNQILVNNQLIEGLEVCSQELLKGGEIVNIIVRASDISIIGSTQEYKCSDNNLVIEAEAIENMFVGSKYRHMIEFGEQVVFADSEHVFSKEKVKIIIPKNRIKVYSSHS